MDGIKDAAETWAVCLSRDRSYLLQSEPALVAQAFLLQTECICLAVSWDKTSSTQETCHCCFSAGSAHTEMWESVRTMTYIQLYSMLNIVLWIGLPALEASFQIYVIIIKVGQEAALSDLTADS